MSTQLSVQAPRVVGTKSAKPSIDCYLEVPENVVQTLGNKKWQLVLAIREIGGSSSVQSNMTGRSSRTKRRVQQNQRPQPVKSAAPAKQAKAAKPAQSRRQRKAAKPSKAAAAAPRQNANQAGKSEVTKLSRRQRKRINAEKKATSVNPNPVEISEENIGMFVGY